MKDVSITRKALILAACGYYFPFCGGKILSEAGETDKFFKGQWWPENRKILKGENEMAKIAMNSTTTMFCNIVSEIKTAKEAGFKGIEIRADKLFRYMDVGYDIKSLLPLLDGLDVVAIGALQNLERRGERYDEYIKDVHRYCSTAQKIGAGMVQMCTGPSEVSTVKAFAEGKTLAEDIYTGTLGKSEEEMLYIAAENIAAAADIAAEYGIELYLEPLAWVPFGKISQAVKVIENIGRKNVGIVVDIWHMWTMDESPEYVATLDKDIIKIAHICDGLDYDRSEIPDQDILRDVWIGEGDIPVKRYVDAIKQTGYDGWYSTETFCKKKYEDDPLETAKKIKGIYENLLD